MEVWRIGGEVSLALHLLPNSLPCSAPPHPWEKIKKGEKPVGWGLIGEAWKARYTRVS